VAEGTEPDDAYAPNCVLWGRLSSGGDTAAGVALCGSMWLCPLMRNVSPLCYMRARTRGTDGGGGGVKRDNEKEAVSRVREYSYTTPFCPVFTPTALYSVASGRSV
jgi:hypothetical protein